MKRDCCKQGLVLVACITWASSSKAAGWRCFPSRYRPIFTVVINEIAPAWHFTGEPGLCSSSSSCPQGPCTYCDGAPAVGSGYTTSVLNLSWLASHTRIHPLFPPHLSHFSPHPCAFEVKCSCAIRLLLPGGEHCHTVVLGIGISSISVTVLRLI